MLAPAAISAFASVYHYKYSLRGTPVGPNAKRGHDALTLSDLPHVLGARSQRSLLSVIFPHRIEPLATICIYSQT